MTKIRVLFWHANKRKPKNRALSATSQGRGSVNVEDVSAYTCRNLEAIYRLRISETQRASGSSITPQAYSDLDALALAALLKAGSISVREVHELAVEATAKANKVFNFALDLQNRGPLPVLSDSLLAGVPTLIKDINGHLEGYPIRFGSRLYEGITNPKNTHVGLGITRSGMDVIGVSSAPEFSLEGHTHNLLTGDVHNPWV